MGHGTANDIMDDFKKAHKDLDVVHNLLQLSMHGPNVNWAFHGALEEYRKTEDPNAPSDQYWKLLDPCYAWGL